ncbi:OmpR family two-component system bacitracin resistance sensor histidine kinase BceS [Paenibacillus shirakamiensis]|uniref:histidine kinase n=1 Tax=Paenibacillus shirakamiensis TaxID=1265935 RepID=A0ABS4JKH4_9BACL|nr:sensor histidine kinase [Paenibacillus shirakamiensis]MBP2002215.1 OmpR family two-component system bacitracin resistance sensor histidine kinase BceS [Paenibacillus shirakamiensis]
MIRAYVRERLSWIVLFLWLLLLLMFIGYVDAEIPFQPIIYVIFLFGLVFGVFLIVRYFLETRFYRNIVAWEPGYDLSTLEEASSPFEQLTLDLITQQTDRARQEASQHLMDVEQEKDDLLAWIHEVKTPLTAMQLMIERMEDRVLQGQLMYEWLRVHLLLDQQLHHKRIPFIQNDVYMEQAPLEPLIYQEIKALQSWCMQKGIGFDVHLSVPTVLSDMKWLGFIIRQILTNAVKYSHASDIVIESLFIHGKTHLRITDYGRGIDPKDLPRIFEKGFTSTAHHGDSASTGMGLYLAQKAAHSLLIHIEVSSKLGQESIFTLIFPEKNAFSALLSM